MHIGRISELPHEDDIPGFRLEEEGGDPVSPVEVEPPQGPGHPSVGTFVAEDDFIYFEKVVQYPLPGLNFNFSHVNVHSVERFDGRLERGEGMGGAISSINLWDGTPGRNPTASCREAIS